MSTLPGKNVPAWYRSRGTIALLRETLGSHCGEQLRPCRLEAYIPLLTGQVLICQHEFPGLLPRRVTGAFTAHCWCLFTLLEMQR